METSANVVVPLLAGGENPFDRRAANTICDVDPRRLSKFPPGRATPRYGI